MDINDQYEFFRKVKLTEDGYLIVSGNGGGTPEEVEITINGNTYKSVEAPDTENILVKDQNDNTVGSLINGEWIVQIPTFTDAEISINGVFYDVYSSGETDNILVVDQDDNEVGSLDLVSGKWVVTLPTFTDVELSINNTPIDNYGSGQAPNILVKDEDGNEVGSLINGEWIVPSAGSGI